MPRGQTTEVWFSLLPFFPVSDCADMSSQFHALRKLLLIVYTIFLLFSSLSQSIQDNRITVPQPASGYTAKQGDVLFIQFTCNDPYIRRLDIDLMNGPSLNAGLVMRITDAALPCQKSWKWQIPSTVAPASGSYFIRLSGLNSKGAIVDYGYSGRFNIEAGVVSGRAVEQVHCTMEPPPTGTTTSSSTKMTTSPAPTETQSNSTHTSTAIVSSTTTEIILETPTNSDSVATMNWIVLNCVLLMMPLILYF